METEERVVREGEKIVKPGNLKNKVVEFVSFRHKEGAVRGLVLYEHWDGFLVKTEWKHPVTMFFSFDHIMSHYFIELSEEESVLWKICYGGDDHEDTYRNG